MDVRAVFLERVRRIVSETRTPDEAARAILAALDEGYDPGAGDDSPGWALIEIDPDTGDETGRDLRGLSVDF
jgi:hypothetical protein